MSKRAATRYPIHDLLAERWSPRAFADRDVSAEDLGSLLEAARWAASSYNEQPWVFFVATRAEPEAWQRMLSCLVPFNAGWAKGAPVLALSVARKAFASRGEANRHAWHDVGLATGNLTLQAQALGLAVHPMAGFDAARARELYAIPDDAEPVAMLAIGHPGDAATLPAGLRAKEAAPRERKPLAHFVFGPTWGRPASAFEGGGR